MIGTPKIRVVPELQRRGLFRREYEGKTLRENLGLPRPRKPLLQQAKRLVETLVFDLLFRALALAQLRGALFFGAPETNPIFLRLGLGLGAPALLAVLVKVDDHRLGSLHSREVLRTLAGCCRGAIPLCANAPLRHLPQDVILEAIR